MGQAPAWDCVFVRRQQGLSVRTRGRHQRCWEETDFGTHVGISMNKVDLERPTTFLDRVCLGLYSTRMQSEQPRRRVQKDVRVTNFRRSNRTVASFWENGSNSVVLRHGGTRKEMR